MEIKYWEARYPAIRTAPVSRREIVAHVIHDLLRWMEWTDSAAKVCPRPPVRSARIIRRKQLSDREEVTIRCSKRVYDAVEQWIEELVEKGFHGGPIPQKLPPPRP